MAELKIKHVEEADENEEFFREEAKAERKLFRNRKANIAICIGFGLVALAFILALVIKIAF